MDIDEIPPLDIPTLYYAYISLNILHLLVSSALLVWRRNKFPVNGHNLYMTMFFGVAVAFMSAVGSGRGVLTADTCTPGTAVMYLGGIMIANVMAAQMVHIWFEFNFGEAQMRVRNTEMLRC